MGESQVERVAAMPQGDRDLWNSLNSYWEKRSSARGTPRWLAEGTEKVGGAAARAADAAGQQIGRIAPDAAKRAASRVGDTLLIPAAKAAIALLKLTSDWAVELHDPARVVELARSRNLDVQEVADLKSVSLKDCDALLGRHGLKWRTVGAVEGGTMGALALVPVAGIPVSITADIVVMDVRPVSLARRGSACAVPNRSSRNTSRGPSVFAAEEP